MPQLLFIGLFCSFLIIIKEIGKIRALDPGKWTEENTPKAVEDVTNQKMKVDEASCFMIWIGSVNRTGSLSELGLENELRLIVHIKKLESVGFPFSTIEIAVYCLGSSDTLK